CGRGVPSGGGTASAISPEPLLVAMVMDRLTDEVRQESPWTTMFAGDIVMCSREQVEEKLEERRFALESSKTENERDLSGSVRLQGEEIKKGEDLKNLGSTVQTSGECGKEVKKRVQAGWNWWGKVSGVMCDRGVSAKIKRKVDKTVARPAIIFGLETVPLRKRQEAELELAEMKALDHFIQQN
ncbi:unnamed protein product, partial [Tetraodon nigroviridis]